VTYPNVQDDEATLKEQALATAISFNPDASTARNWAAGPKGLLLGLALGVGIALIGGRFVNRSAAPNLPAEESSPIATQSVTVQQVRATQLNQTLTATGTVQAWDLLQVTPQVSGLQIREVRVRAGDRVTAGQVLAVLDDSILQAQIQQAEANRAQAEAQVAQQSAAKAQAEATLVEAEENFRRYQALFDQGAISAEQLTSRRTQVTTARESVRVAIANIESARANVNSKVAEISQIQTQLAQTLVKAPADGIIAERNATIGDTASTSTSLYQLIREDVLELEVKLPQSQLAQVVVGTLVTITSPTDERIQFQGSVRTIDPTLNAQTRQATLQVSLPASDRLRPGMLLQADIVTGTRQGLTLPAAALLPQPDNTFAVYTLTPENTARFTPIEIGTRLPARGDQSPQVEILAGLEPTASVIVEGAAYVQPGDTVTVVENLEF
jgi:HlyD family secretion protein